MTPLDTTPPVIVATDPVDNETNAPTVLPFVAIFDEPVFADTGDIRIINDTDAETTTIAVTNGAQVSISGTSLSIDPTVALTVGKDYHIEMDAGVVTNIVGLAFVGISNSTDWNFKTDDTPPTLVSMEDNVGGGPIYEDQVEVTYTVTFNEPIDGAKVTTNDFDNAGTATFSIGTVTEISSTVFTVVVMPSLTGTLQLRIPTGSVINDISGNTMVVPVMDDAPITINAGNTPSTWACFIGMDRLSAVLRTVSARAEQRTGTPPPPVGTWVSGSRVHSYGTMQPTTAQSLAALRARSHLPRTSPSAI